MPPTAPRPVFSLLSRLTPVEQNAPDPQFWYMCEPPHDPHQRPWWVCCHRMRARSVRGSENMVCQERIKTLSSSPRLETPKIKSSAISARPGGAGVGGWGGRGGVVLCGESLMAPPLILLFY